MAPPCQLLYNSKVQTHKTRLLKITIFVFIWSNYKVEKYKELEKSVGYKVKISHDGHDKCSCSKLNRRNLGKTGVDVHNDAWFGFRKPETDF